jgi:hypothetical protein
MDTEVCSVTITLDDIWKILKKWDYKLSQKIEKESKKLEVCQKLSTIIALTNDILIYKSYQKTNQLKSCLYQQLSQIKNTLTHIIYNVPRPIHENELYINEKQLWSATHYWQYHVEFDKIRQDVLNKPFDIENIKYDKIKLLYPKNELDTIWEDLA